MIEVTQTRQSRPFAFEVVVRDDSGETRHDVTMTEEAFVSLAGEHDAPEGVIEAAFRFLLDRESKESILPRFDVTVISRYFPEFERELPRYLASG
jgi:hypothetical protein